MLVKMEAYSDGEFWCARGIGEDIFTQGATLDELFANIKEAVVMLFEDVDEPISILVVCEPNLEKQTRRGPLPHETVWDWKDPWRELRLRKERGLPYHDTVWRIVTPFVVLLAAH